jgi:hypothetical protein
MPRYHKHNKIKNTTRTRILSLAFLNSLDSEALSKQATKLLLNIMLDLWNRNQLTIADFNHYENIAKNDNKDLIEGIYSKYYKMPIYNADNTKAIVIEFEADGTTADLIITSHLNTIELKHY